MADIYYHVSEQHFEAYEQFMKDVDILEKRPFDFYWTMMPFNDLIDVEYWHSIGKRIGEA